MIHDALKYLVGLGVKSVKPELIDLPGNKVGLFVNGELQTFDGDNRRVNSAIGNIESLMHWMTEQEGLRQIWVKGDIVVGDLDAHLPHKCQHVVLELIRSQAFLMLQAWVDTPAAQKSVVRMLRGPLDGCFDAGYLSVFRALDFSRRSDGTKTIEHARESLGRSVESRAQSAGGEIPQTLVFDVPVFTCGLGAEKLRFAVDVDAENERISINPIGDCMEDAQQVAREKLVGFLTERLPDVEVYLGA